MGPGCHCYYDAEEFVAHTHGKFDLGNRAEFAPLCTEPCAFLGHGRRFLGFLDLDRLPYWSDLHSALSFSAPDAVMAKSETLPVVGGGPKHKI